MVIELNKEISNYQRFLSGEYCNYLDTEVLVMINRTKDYLCVLNDIKTVEYERKEILSNSSFSLFSHSTLGNERNLFIKKAVNSVRSCV